MKDYFKRYLSGDEWLIKEKEWKRQLQAVRETQLSLGNGLLGSRGALEEKPPGCHPGTYLTGFYDKTGSLVSELVNLPNPFALWFALKGEKLGIVAMDSTSHSRSLDLHKGLLVRHTLYRDTRKRRYDYQSMRFLSMYDKNIGVMQIYLTPLDASAELTVTAALDTAVYTSGTVTEDRKKHWSIREVSHEGGIEYMRISGLDSGYSVAMASCILETINGKSHIAPDTVFPIRLKKGQTACLTKIFTFHSSGYQSASDIFQATTLRLKRAMKCGFRKLLNSHTRAWAKLWESATVTIEGAAAAEQALRFNIFHLLCCGPAAGTRFSIGARTLSGDGYRGHIFWDSDIFILPFFTHVNPMTAIEMLLYRYDRLNPARQIARQKGYRGAMYPWESADSGEEQTPAWAKGFDGKVIPIHTHEQEHHITADVAYSVHRYYTATRDEGFMLACGFEILFATARFWASRVELNKRSGSYKIRGVIGPDEFHEKVNNNAYTNMMAKWNLLIAYRMAILMKSRYRREFEALSRRINLKSSELKSWKRIAPRITVKQRKDGVIEQFDGYWRLQRVPLLTRNTYGIPSVPKGFDLNKAGRTQLVKQADVVMLLYLLSDIYGLKTKKRNYYHYEPKTLHKSSLSPAMHAIAASEIGDIESAYKFFQMASMIDLKESMGNTAEGMHAAALGGVWQAAVHGFGGMRISRGKLHIKPSLPKAWKSMAFSFWWRGQKLQIFMDREKVRICVCAGDKKRHIRIKAYARNYELPVNRTVTFHKKGQLVLSRKTATSSKK